MQVLSRLFAVIGICLLVIQTGFAQFVSADQIPIAVQQEIVESVIEEYGELNLDVFRNSLSELFVVPAATDGGW